jgi:hypothetical protein
MELVCIILVSHHHHHRDHNHAFRKIGHRWPVPVSFIQEPLQWFLFLISLSSKDFSTLHWFPHMFLSIVSSSVSPWIVMLRLTPSFLLPIWIFPFFVVLTVQFYVPHFFLLLSFILYFVPSFFLVT